MPDTPTVTPLVDELLPCPFCGKQPLIVAADNSYGSAIITCGDDNDCPVDLTAWGDLKAGETLADAIAAWNTRTALRPLEADDAGLIEKLTSERDFLLARATEAGKCSLNRERWTGLSSNALVEIAFGGENGRTPGGGQDLAACYRTVMRLPKHLLSERVFAHLERGEKRVSESSIAWAREITGCGGAVKLRATLRPVDSGRRGAD